jgi:beta-lactam-binding protein with PASTA domain
VRRLRAADLVAGIKPAVSRRPAGIVIGTWPRAGTRVRSHTLVRVEVSGTAAGPG